MLDLGIIEHRGSVFDPSVLLFSLSEHRFAIFLLSKHVRNSAKALVELRFITDTSVIKAIDRKSNLWTKFSTAKRGDCTASVVTNLLIINKMIGITTRKNGSTESIELVYYQTVSYHEPTNHSAMF